MKFSNGVLRNAPYPPYRLNPPDFTKYCPVRPINEALAPYVNETLQAYNRRSKYVNKHHYYHNRTVLVKEYLTKDPHPVSLNQLSQYYDDSSRLTKQKIISSGVFVKEELSIRLAHQLNMLQQLPYNVVNNFHFNQVYESYYNMFERIRRMPGILTIEENAIFTRMLIKILHDFNSLNLPHLIMGALECMILGLYPSNKMDELVSYLLRARISRRIIAEEHISITENFSKGKTKNATIFGDIFQKCSAEYYLKKAALQAQRFIGDMYFPTIPMPEFKIEGDTDLSFYFLPNHITYLLGEILRNTYEATIKEYIRSGSSKPSPITVTVISNKDFIIFRISDLAGGVHLDENQLWSFGKSKEKAKKSLDNFHKLPGLQTISIYDHLYDKKSISRKEYKKIQTNYYYSSLTPMGYVNPWHKDQNRSDITTEGFNMNRPLLGLFERSFRYKLGIGLAMCKVYADYWNGDVQLHSMEGYGTDTVLKLRHLTNYSNVPQLDKL
ncbi:hypothetical protein TBLA_0F02450 [Henningerozyma blattae CBS 6284]|uniref:Protein-serine/threonine kinase n=1 Tax=Henningerozyma blattae (strain ATCC 34711 / CBS 6284 / DSM 70876 / NBRC 10599 / NRRL Y-10934 / UCD 77-7) TaxID=1071380 RepID=I2H5Y3_HENB6|nr:hypothetical protein TBLA_0F02450 [Tetrapisispora blattae CBS 6284]CCH61785.1 hypothetical protein TBLA_0F02450 [Tetrapisispora blattae CBS 6284]